MLGKVKLQNELAHVSHFETCCFGVATVSHRTENSAWGMMTFHKIMRIAEHPPRADQSTIGAIMQFENLIGIMNPAYAPRWLLR
jgi:hypothetical protein